MISFEIGIIQENKRPGTQTRTTPQSSYLNRATRTTLVNIRHRSFDLEVERQSFDVLGLKK